MRNDDGTGERPRLNSQVPDSSELEDQAVAHRTAVGTPGYSVILLREVLSYTGGRQLFPPWL